MLNQVNERCQSFRVGRTPIINCDGKFPEGSRTLEHSGMVQSFIFILFFL